MSSPSKPQQPQQISKGVKFLFGGTAGMGATLFVQPLDLVKNRMQLSGADGAKKQYKTSVHAFFTILKTEGLSGAYTGLSAGLLRQATYTTTRLGIYTSLFDMFSKDGKPPNFATKAALGIAAGACGAFVGTPAEVALIRMTADGRDGKPPSFSTKAGLGIIAGACGAFVGTPSDVALIRMTADGSKPLDQRRNYKNVIDALARIVKEEGVVTLWRGCVPTMGRAMVVNAAQLASYSQAKQNLISTGYFQDGLFLHFCASMISGLITTAASMPVDIVKTRIQNMKYIDGKPEYKGIGDVLSRVIKNEGFFSLWKGFTPYYARLGPHTVLTFIFLEQFNASYRRYVLHDTTTRGGL